MNTTFKQGEIICRENTYENWMYEIISGCIEVVKDYEMDTQKTLAEVRSGFIGEMGMLDTLPRAATLIAKEETVLRYLDRDGLEDYVAAEPEKSTELLLCMMDRLNKLNGDYLDACNTIKDYLETEEKEKSLLGRMKKFASIFRGR